MLQSIVDDFKRGIVDEKKIEKVERDPFRYFHLNDAVGMRPSVLQYILPLDDTFLFNAAMDVSKSPTAGKRVGVDWLPRSANAFQKKEESDDHWVTNEQLKPLNDVCTKWCTYKYFPDAFSRVNMVANVIRLYDRLRDVTGLKFDIIFKGGVMIRLILLEFLNNLPLEARQKITEFMADQKALSISDFDFEIVARNHDPCDDEVHRFFLLDYAVLLWLQRAMQLEVERERPGMLSLDWGEEGGREELREKLQAEVDDMGKESPFFKARIDAVFIGDTVHRPPSGYRTKSGKATPSPRMNALIFDCGDTKCVMQAHKAFREFGVRGVPSSSGGSRFYATLNTYIGEEKSGEGATRASFLRGVFHLARIKHSFVVYYTTKSGQKCCDRLAGEMVDLSQSHGVRLDLLRRSLYAKCPHPYKEYPILGVDTREVVLRSYSVEGFLLDHRSMIHNTEEEPWNVNKKEKRMVRYVGFLFAHVLSPAVSGTMAQKMGAMGKLVDKLCSLEELLASPLRTGVRPVDEFAQCERQSLHSAPKGKAKEYLKAFHGVFNSLFECMHSHVICAQPLMLDSIVLSTMQRYILDNNRKDDRF